MHKKRILTIDKFSIIAQARTMLVSLCGIRVFLASEAKLLIFRQKIAVTELPVTNDVWYF